ncbi:M23 family metallopeptidase [Spirillospora sp. CA-255316]
MHKAMARFRTPFILLGVILMLSESVHGADQVSLAGIALLALGAVLFFVPARGSARPPITLRSPVSGRWVPVNSPADKVPSHGTHELGQTYAIDLVYAPDPDVAWKALGSGAIASRPETFPAFGRPVAAPADGVAVQVCGWQRDHWSRNSWPAFLYMIVEGMLFRQALSLLTFSGGRFLLGNHVVLDLGDGTYAVLAHLRRGSVRVRKGQRVRAGDVLGEVGNSGNSSEPHLHFHVMDSPRHMIAAGVPFAFPYESDGEIRTGVPGGQRPFVVGPETVSRAA